MSTAGHGSLSWRIPHPVCHRPQTIAIQRNEVPQFKSGRRAIRAERSCRRRSRPKATTSTKRQPPSANAIKSVSQMSYRVQPPSDVLTSAVVPRRAEDLVAIGAAGSRLLEAPLGTRSDRPRRSLSESPRRKTCHGTRHPSGPYGSAHLEESTVPRQNEPGFRYPGMIAFRAAGRETIVAARRPTSTRQRTRNETHACQEWSMTDLNSSTNQPKSRCILPDEPQVPPIKTHPTNRRRHRRPTHAAPTPPGPGSAFGRTTAENPPRQVAA